MFLVKKKEYKAIPFLRKDSDYDIILIDHSLERSFRMVIKNTTVYTGEEVVNEIVQYGRKSFYKKFIFPSILLILGAIVILITFQGDSKTSLMMGSLFLIFAGILFLMNVVSIFTLRKKTQKRNPEILKFGMKNDFTFKEESFILLVTIGTKTTKLEYFYKDIKRIIEFDEKLLFMITDTDFYSCKKETFHSKKELDLFFYGLEKHKIKIKKKLHNQKQIQKD